MKALKHQVSLIEQPNGLRTSQMHCWKDRHYGVSLMQAGLRRSGSNALAADKMVGSGPPSAWSSSVTADKMLDLSEHHFLSLLVKRRMLVTWYKSCGAHIFHFFVHTDEQRPGKPGCIFRDKSLKRLGPPDPSGTKCWALA